MQLLYLDPTTIERDPAGVREENGDVTGLARTIREQGLLQPLGVVTVDNNRYRVVYGGRRLGAALHLGLDRVPCILFEGDDTNLLVRQVIENVQRQDLNDIEKARAFRRLRDEFAGQPDRPSEGDLDERVANAVGLAPRTIRRYLGLLDLPPEIQQMIRDDELNVTQAQHLRRVARPETQVELARHAADEGLSAAEVSKLVNYFVANAELSLSSALDALQSGQELRTTASLVDQEQLAPMSAGLQGAREARNEADSWNEDAAVDEEDESFAPFTDASEQSRDKARVFRLRSLDQMVDETDRISRAIHEGDVRKWIERDENAAFKIRLLVKQLRTVSQELEALAEQQGWPL